MNQERLIFTISRVAACAVLVLGAAASVAVAKEPCFEDETEGECKVLIEINASDGDIGFHFLSDADDLVSFFLYGPHRTKVFQDHAKGPLFEQKLTETFVESAEPPCWWEKDNEDVDWDEDEAVYLEDFLDLWTAGEYIFRGDQEDGEKVFGFTNLTYLLPAAPAEVDFDGSVISWEAGDDLGECADFDDLVALVPDTLPMHPEDVLVDMWEVVLEPDVEDGDPTGALKYTVRVAGDISPTSVTVPADYLASLPDDTPVKVEVGAIGGEDNATFTEEDGFCVNEDEGCEED